MSLYDVRAMEDLFHAVHLHSYSRGKAILIVVIISTYSIDSGKVLLSSLLILSEVNLLNSVSV